MTLAALMLIVGLGVGWVGACFWQDIVELIDIYREGRSDDA